MVRFGAMLVIFMAWLGWLGYIALHTRQTVIVSRPQILVSNLDVIARIDRQDATEVKVDQVHWPASQEKLKDQTLAISNLAECAGWSGPGSYVIPLTADGKTWHVTLTPRSPGYPVAGKPRIYPASAESLRQVDEVEKGGG
jgi:hypothetical protein